MYCKKCKQNIMPDCCYTNGICVFCFHNITEWDSNGQLITRYEAIIPLYCPYCEKIILPSWRRGKGCHWCQK